MRDTDEDIFHAYQRDMTARRLSAETIANYRFTLEKLSAALPASGLLGATAAQLRTWLASLREFSAASHATWFRRVRTFYSWCVRMEYLDSSPMAKMRPPREESKVIPVPDVADITKVLDVTARDKSFRGRRDLAMFRLMLETGTPRASAIANLDRTGVDLRHDCVTVMDKGRKERVIPLGAKAAHAMHLYLRARMSHPKAGSDRLFIGKRGAMTRDGVYQIIAERCEQAGVPVISPHRWRHFTADAWFAAGGSEGDAMALFGWSTPAMAHRYGGAAAARRAQAHARAAGLADAI